MNLRQFVTGAVTALMLAGGAAAERGNASPGVGDSLKALAGLDQAGRARTAASLAGRRGAVITFLRSADWCPSCKVQLVELEGVRGALAAAGYGLAAVTIDDVPILRDFAAAKGIGYPLISGRQAIAELGMVDSRFDGDEVRRGAPHPAIYVVDPALEVRRIFPEGERYTVGAVLAHIGVSKGPSAWQHQTAQASARAWTSDPDAPPNRRFGLVVDVEPGKAMHLYAPGDHRYKAVRLTIDPADGLDPEPLEFPPSEPYLYKPLGETVPVFAKPFRLVQNVQVRQKAGTPPRIVTITGTLEYQACDDLVCYPPVRVPLSWKVRIAD